MNQQIEITLKWANALSASEIKEMNNIIHSYDKGLPENHLKDTHIKKHNPLFVLAKQKERVISFQCHSIYYAASPFFEKPVPIIFGGAAYHAKDHLIKGLANKMALLYLRHCFGRFWFLKKLTVIADTVNPKSLRAMHHIFNGAYPDMRTPVPHDVITFAETIMQQYYGEHVAVDEHLVMRGAHNYQGLTDITDYWDKMYKTKQGQYDTFYLDQEVIKKIGEHYFIGGESIVAISFYSPKKLLRSILYKLFRSIAKKVNGTPWWQREKVLYKEKALLR